MVERKRPPSNCAASSSHSEAVEQPIGDGETVAVEPLAEVGPVERVGGEHARIAIGQAIS